MSSPKNIGIGIDTDKLLKNTLKPEEIAGDTLTQLHRVRELLGWFVRFTDGNANPKWLIQHANELAYYIATTDQRVAMLADIHEIERKAFYQGINATAEERALAKRVEKMNNGD